MKTTATTKNRPRALQHKREPFNNNQVLITMWVAVVAVLVFFFHSMIYDQYCYQCLKNFILNSCIVVSTVLEFVELC